MSKDNEKDDNNIEQKDRKLSELKTSEIRDSDEFQNEFEMVAQEVELKQGTNAAELWMTRIKVLLFSGVFASIGNYINTSKAGNPITPIEVLPALSMLFAVVVLGCALDDALRKTIKLNLPSIVYISLISVFCSIPNFLPWGNYYVQEIGKIGLLPLCTPILAYAGISLAKDLPEFRKQGVAIVCVALMAFVGTYVGSAIIAQICLKLFGQI